MTVRASILIPFVVALAARLRAGEDVESIEFRVLSARDGGLVVVDRGARDGVAVGDRARFRPRDGGEREGTVVEVDERSAVVEPAEKGFVPEPGTRGTVLVPRARLEPEEPEKGPGEEAAPPGEEAQPPRGRGTGPEWTPDMPLLGARPLRPEQRAMRVSGRAYVIGGFAGGPGDAADSLLRVGADVLVQNPFRRGDELRANVELDALTEQDETEATEILVRRFAYTWGGTRFADTRWEVGRFLQRGMPEFGVLDGAEWGRRRENGHRFGVSLGYMPEPDEDFESFTDF